MCVRAPSGGKKGAGTARAAQDARGISRPRGRSTARMDLVLRPVRHRAGAGTRVASPVSGSTLRSICNRPLPVIRWVPAICEVAAIDAGDATDQSTRVTAAHRCPPRCGISARPPLIPPIATRRRAPRSNRRARAARAACRRGPRTPTRPSAAERSRRDGRVWTFRLPAQSRPDRAG